MKPSAPSLTPLLRSNAQGDILALLLLQPDAEFSLSDIVRRIGALPATVHREIGRLVESGFLENRTVGRSRMVRANARHPLHGPLSEMILSTYGPRVILQRLFTDLPDADKALIYGSWAARYAGEPGPPPRDIDVLIVGTTTREQLTEAARQAQQQLKHEVNITRVSPAEWAGETTAFVRTLKSRPLVDIPLDQNETQ